MPSFGGRYISPDPDCICPECLYETQESQQRYQEAINDFVTNHLDSYQELLTYVNSFRKNIIC